MTNPSTQATIINTTAKNATNPSRKGNTYTVESNPKLQDASWATVVGRKQRRQDRRRTRMEAPTSGSGPTTIATAPTAAYNRQSTKKTTRKRPIRTAAVSITVRKKDVSYSEVLSHAQQHIDLKSLGIEETKIKRAITGGILIQIPGPEKTEKADQLASSLRSVFKNNQDINIGRPVKQADIRLTGLDDSTTPAEAIRILSTLGECPREVFKTGNIRYSRRGMGTIWVRCPYDAALKITACPKLKIGWTIVRAQLLQPRQLHCYRCMEKGHVQQTCNSPTDRSSRCYNCGREDHMARDCRYRTKCPVCSDYGLQADHRLGGDKCNPPRRALRRQQCTEQTDAPIGTAQTSCSEQTKPTSTKNQTGMTQSKTKSMTRTVSTLEDSACTTPLPSEGNVNANLRELTPNISIVTQSQDDAIVWETQ